MSAIRYCGALRIRVTYRDATNDYRCAVTPWTEKADRYLVTVGVPNCLDCAVDSPAAFDATARAALAFAADAGYPVDEYACIDATGAWTIARSVTDTDVKVTW